MKEEDETLRADSDIARDLHQALMAIVLHHETSHDITANHINITRAGVRQRSEDK